MGKVQKFFLFVEKRMIYFQSQRFFHSSGVTMSPASSFFLGVFHFILLSTVLKNAPPHINTSLLIEAGMGIKEM
jgi:hypothetical protein